MVTRGYPYAEESEVGADLHGYTEVLGFSGPRQMCFFDVHVVYTDAASYYGRHPHHILSQHKRHREFRDLARERRLWIYRIWALLGR